MLTLHHSAYIPPVFITIEEFNFFSRIVKGKNYFIGGIYDKRRTRDAR